MKTSFYRSSNITKEQLSELSKRTNHPALLRFLLVLTLFLLCSCWVVVAWNSPWWNLALSQLGFGIMVCSVFAGLHETAHGTAFASRSLNRVAAFVFGIFHIYPSSIFRDFHFAHHRHTHIPGKDPEISLGNRPAPSYLSNLPFYLSWLSGLPYLLVKVFMILACALGIPEPLRRNVFPFFNPKRRLELFVESVIAIATYLLIIALAIFVNRGFLGIIVGQIIGHLFLAFYLTLEHNDLPHDGDILDKTRSINTNAVVKLIMWNMPFHAEHHAYPSVPFHSLPSLSEKLADELVHTDDAISSFHYKTVKRLISKNV